MQKKKQKKKTKPKKKQLQNKFPLEMLGRIIFTSWEELFLESSLDFPKCTKNCTRKN